LGIGVDVGGTNTDAVLMDGLTVDGEVKTPTTDGVTTGTVTAVRRPLEETRLPASRIRSVMIGTTLFTNAVVEARRLTPTAAVRLGLPATRALPPMTDRPEGLVQATGTGLSLPWRPRV
jgi:N-methylhydantoinase A/oxoprolinase/acetone carboxylase beta subunit